uniref:Uncharacterized protein n=1 Tax=Setaria italica TaxID=4555 RepID=K4AKF1_SETIT
MIQVTYTLHLIAYCTYNTLKTMHVRRQHVRNHTTFKNAKSIVSTSINQNRKKMFLYGHMVRF